MAAKRQYRRELTEEERAEVLDFANGNSLHHTRLQALKDKGLLQMVYSLTVEGCEVAQEGGWKWD